MRQLIVENSAEAAKVHLLPCTVEHNGPAQVSSYFRPTPAGNSIEGQAVLEGSFRGRKLEGARLPLPEGYMGVVVAQQQREPEGDEPPSTYWAATHTFSEVHYWNHDAMPLKGDSMRRCLEWAQLAAQMHQPLNAADVQAALANSSPQ